MPKYENKCPQHIELDLYQGCSFNCIYCISNGENDRPPADLKNELLKIAENQHINTPYYLSPWTDAYQHREEKSEYTRNVIKTLSTQNQPFFVITKSLLVQRDLEYFSNKENAFIAISLNTLNDGITAVFEPDAPTASKRREMIEQLVQEKDIKTVIKIDPIIPGVTDGQELDRLLEWLATIKPYAVTAETLRLSKSIVENISNHIDKYLLDSILGHYDKVTLQPKHPKLEYRTKMLQSINQRLKRTGVKAAFCKASLPIKINEFDCRGGYNYDY